MSVLPERINVTKVVSYDVAKIVDDIIESGSDTNKETVTLWDIMQHIEAWIEDDFSCGNGHTTNTSDLIFQDENGEELSW